MNRDIAIFTLTECGERLAHTLQQQALRDAVIYHKVKPFKSTVQQAFQQGKALVMICATGIVMRSLAPVLRDKKHDPPVLVLDEYGRFVIPLCSGHEGGANAWAHTIADHLGAQAVITTADHYCQPVYAVGIGCERNCPHSALESLLQDALQQAHLSLSNIHSINSIDIKANEAGLITLAKSLQKPFYTHNRETLAAMEPLLSVKSTVVYREVGVYGVAEAAALSACQQATQSTPELVVNKIKNTQATCAIARSYPLNRSPNQTPTL